MEDNKEEIILSEEQEKEFSGGKGKEDERSKFSRKVYKSHTLFKREKRKKDRDNNHTPHGRSFNS